MKIFISYAWADLTHSLLPKFVNALEAANYEVWFDQEQLHAGDLIRPNLEKALADVDVVVYLYTQTAAQRPDCQYELATALRLKKPVIPCFLDEYALKNPCYHASLPENVAGLGIVFIGEPIQGMSAFEEGMDRLESRLIRLEVEVLHTQVNSKESADLLQQIEELNRLLGRLQTIRHRQRLGVSGNAETVAACEMCLSLAEKLYRQDAQRKGTPEATQMAEFIIQTRRVNLDPALDDIGKKKALLQLLKRIDPTGANPLLLVIRQTLERQLGDVPTEGSGSQPIASPDSVAPADPVAQRLHTLRQQVAAAQQHDQQHQWLRHYLGQSLGNHGLDEWVDFARQYISYVPTALAEAWSEANRNQLSSEFQPFLDELMTYFEKPDDYLPDQYGLYGLLDDAYLAARTVEELNRSFRERFGKSLLSVDFGRQNQYIANLLGPALANRINADVVARIPRIQTANPSKWQALGLLALVGLGIAQTVQQQQNYQSIEEQRLQLLWDSIS